MTEPTETNDIAALHAKANAGNAAAQWLLGYAYDVGQGVSQDYAQAQYNLGLMYAIGRGVPQDHEQEAAWYRQAADQGGAAAQFNLGGAYANGRGVPQDYVEAHKWCNLAASRTSAKAQKECAETRDALAKSMTPAQIADAQKLAREWLAAFEARSGK